MNQQAKGTETGADNAADLFLAGVVSADELKTMAPRATRFEIQPAVVLLWDFRTKSYTHRWTR